MSHIAMSVRDLWRSIPAAGRNFSEESRQGDFLHSVERACTLALLELFGLMTVERDKLKEGQSWRVTAVRHTAFGDALLGIVFKEIERELFAHTEKTKN